MPACSTSSSRSSNGRAGVPSSSSAWHDRTSSTAARPDAPPAAARALLQDASILGKTFTLAGLSGISGEAEPALESRLHGLIPREILEPDVHPRSPERGQYGFGQSVIRQGAYGA